MNIKLSVLILLSVVVLMNCTAKQVYSTLHDWQSQRCKSVVDNGERERCLEEANRTYHEYINSDEYKESNS